MKVIQSRFSNLILARGFEAVTVWPFIFVRTDAAVTRQLLTHEHVHGRQQLEMLWFPFFLWYVIEWLIGHVTWQSKTSSSPRSVTVIRDVTKTLTPNVAAYPGAPTLTATQRYQGVSRQY